MTAMFFGAHAINGKATRIDQVAHPCNPVDPLLTIKNTFNMAPLFFTDIFPCVSEPLRDKLIPHVQATFRTVAFCRTFEFPYAADSADYKRDALWPAYVDDCLPVFLKFAERYACQVPDLSYYEVSAFGRKHVEHQYEDWTSVDLIDPDNRVFIRGLDVSASMVDVLGVVDASHGLLVSDEVAEIIRPYLVEPFMWLRRLS